MCGRLAQGLRALPSHGRGHGVRIPYRPPPFSEDGEQKTEDWALARRSKMCGPVAQGTERRSDNPEVEGPVFAGDILARKATACMVFGSNPSRPTTQPHSFREFVFRTSFLARN